MEEEKTNLLSTCTISQELKVSVTKSLIKMHLTRGIESVSFLCGEVFSLTSTEEGFHPQYLGEDWCHKNKTTLPQRLLFAPVLSFTSHPMKYENYYIIHGNIALK